MKKLWLVAVTVAGVLAVAVVVAPSSGADPSRAAAPAVSACSSGFVDAVVGGEHKCLHAGEFCSMAHEADYERYGFTCVNGHLQSGAPAATVTPSTGATVVLRARTRTSGCRVAALPDRRCSPGAYYSGLTKAVICSGSFRTSTIRNVPESEKHAVEAEYGLAPKSYGRTLEVDHIVSLELGGSNDIANLFPEKGVLPGHQPGFRVKDKLENAVHAAVCSGQMSLRSAQLQIAASWELLYTKVYGTAPTA